MCVAGPGWKLGDVDDDDSVVVIPALVANHLRALAEVLLRNDERGAVTAYVDVRPLRCLCLDPTQGSCLLRSTRLLLLHQG